MSKTLAEVLQELPSSRQQIIEERMEQLINLAQDGLYKDLTRYGTNIGIQRYTNGEDYYRQDRIEYRGEVYLVAKKNGELQKIYKEF